MGQSDPYVFLLRQATQKMYSNATKWGCADVEQILHWGLWVYFARSVQYSRMHHFGETDCFFFLKIWKSRLFCTFSWKVYTKKIKNICAIQETNCRICTQILLVHQESCMYHIQRSWNFDCYFRHYFCWEQILSKSETAYFAALFHKK